MSAGSLAHFPTMQNICYDSQAFTIFRRGGIAKHFACLATSVETRGWWPRLTFPLCSNEHYFEFGGASLAAMPQFRGSRSVCGLINRRFERRPRDTRVWHSTYYDRKYLEIYGCDGLIVTVHDMIPELFPGDWPSPHLDKAEYVKNATRIIAVSEQTRDDLCRLYGVPRSQVDVVYHGIGSGGRVEEMALPQEFILYIGQRSGYKNFSELISAWPSLRKLYPDLILLCIGQNGFSASEKLEMAELGISGIIMASASDAQVRYAMQRARAFVFPSLYEGFGLPLLEAMQQRCPIALSNASCFPEIAKESGCYFDPSSPDSIAEAVGRLLRDNELRTSSVRIGELIVEQFSVERMLKQTCDVYSAVL